ncbi:MAG: alpha/beta hydrolase [Brevinematales bacterium]|nr:alpha/beta hydrolase [Brevinematales bacterium]
METLRKWGASPFQVAVLHGGPGAKGDMAPVAQELSKERGVLEPMQNADTIDGLVIELAEVIDTHASKPVVLIGHSWGAWLAWIFAARHPHSVKKLILVGSGPFERRYVPMIEETRVSRLTGEEREDFLAVIKRSYKSSPAEKARIYEKFDDILIKTDNFDPITEESKEAGFDFAQYDDIWPEAAELRLSGALLDIGRGIHCPVTAIHGDYDPHPADGVKIPLSRILQKFKMILLKDCGHSPWRERAARDEFYTVIRREIAG